METIANMVFALAIVFTMYGLFVSVAHMPFLGAFFLLPLLLCIAMFMFMDHGEGSKKHIVHKH